jgi:hypothetical protein
MDAMYVSNEGITYKERRTMTQQKKQKVIGAITRYVGSGRAIGCGARVKIIQVMHGALLPNYNADSDDSHSWCDEDVAERGGVNKNDRVEIRVIREDGELHLGSMDPPAIDLEMFAVLN